jgi:agmatine deiminase
MLSAIQSCENEEIQQSQIVEIEYIMPEESDVHEGTWLQWPHAFQYGKTYQEELDPTWVAMTKALVDRENVDIIDYNTAEVKRITRLLKDEGINLEKIDFNIYQTDDVWIRDNGPIYVRDKSGVLHIQDWGFNAWGEKIDEESGLPITFSHCNSIPTKISTDQNIPLVDLNLKMINEGGSVEIDGNGTLMACKSSILNKNRNPGISQKEAEDIFTKHLGVTHFIWLDGQAGIELTDQHIDGFARFANKDTIVSMNQNDLLAFDVKQTDIDKLYSAKNIYGEPYCFIEVPLTQKTVKKQMEQTWDTKVPS